MSDSTNLNPDPTSERLGRFTPDASALDRDAILFAAGKASVGSSRFWPCLTGLLGTSQAITLFLLFGTFATVQPVTVSSLSLPAMEEKSPVPFSPRDRDSLLLGPGIFRGDLDSFGPPEVIDLAPQSSPVIYTAHSRLVID